MANIIVLGAGLVGCVVGPDEPPDVRLGYRARGTVAGSRMIRGCPSNTFGSSRPLESVHLCINEDVSAGRQQCRLRTRREHFQSVGRSRHARGDCDSESRR